MTPGAGVLVFGRGHIVNIMHISSLLVYSLGYSGDCSGLWASCFSIPGHQGQIIFVHGNNKNDIRDTYMYILHLERVLSQNVISSGNITVYFSLCIITKNITTAISIHYTVLTMSVYHLF